MADDSGVLSVDFLAGFTIFLITFIWVATLVPNLFLGFSSQGIDYDAVAYRTGVILAEDPGASTSLVLGPWQSQPSPVTIARFGLAVSKDTPDVLDENKVNRFFCLTEFNYPSDYQQKVIFGNYPYQFNISLLTAGQNQIQSIGDIIPPNYGYIRRDVKIKSSSNMSLNQSKVILYNYFNNENVSFNQFSVEINSYNLVSGNYRNTIVNPVHDNIYRINPNSDRITINFTDLDKSPPRFAPLPPGAACTDVNLSSIKFYQMHYGDPFLYQLTSAKYTSYQNVSVYADGAVTPAVPPVNIRNNLSVVFDPGLFSETDSNGALFVNFTFGTDPTCSYAGMIHPVGRMQFINNTRTAPYQYDYSAANVTQPVLKDAVLEVAVW